MTGSNCLIICLDEEKRTAIYARLNFNSSPPYHCPAEPSATSAQLNFPRAEQQPKRGLLATDMAAGCFWTKLSELSDLVGHTIENGFSSLNRLQFWSI